MELSSGAIFNLLKPNSTLISLPDIATSLGKICRWNGHCRGFYSVAEHSVLVAWYLRRKFSSGRFAILGLLHDAAEAYIGDITSPVKEALQGNVAPVEGHIMCTIHAALGVQPETKIEAKIVKDADNVLLMTEAYHLLPNKGKWFDIDAEVDLSIKLRCFPWEIAGELFLHACERLKLLKVDPGKPRWMRERYSFKEVFDE